MSDLIKATFTLEVTPAKLAEVLQMLYGQTRMDLWIGEEQFQVVDWEIDPVLGRLRPVERAIMRLDLSQVPRRQIGQRLRLTVNTVTVYRRAIRLKLRAIPPEQHPAPAREWLRRFPGQTGPAIPTKPALPVRTKHRAESSV